jgi:hypothetical protein
MWFGLAGLVLGLPCGYLAGRYESKDPSEVAELERLRAWARNQPQIPPEERKGPRKDQIKLRVGEKVPP